MSLRLDKPRHTRYLVRCLKTFLPSAYTSNDSNRVSLAFFILAGLDLLGALETNTTPAERHDHIAWLYTLQHPNGGFRAFPGADLAGRRSPANAHWDPAHLPATYFALCSLLLLGDDLRRVRRRDCLAWMRTLQRPDGSFGETRVQGAIGGGSDSRFGYCAAGVRYILRGPGPGGVDGDMDVDGLVQCLAGAETYAGGISDSPFHEAHAGLTYCAVASLALLGRLDLRGEAAAGRAPSDPQATIRWLVARQTTMIDDEDTPEDTGGTLEAQARPLGVNGRCNKIADTCYAFWVGGALSIMDQPALLASARIRDWLHACMSHPVLGGFGKHAGDLPDVYHTCLGLAALSLQPEGVEMDGLKELDPILCISKEARDRLPALWKSWESASHD